MFRLNYNFIAAAIAAAGIVGSMYYMANKIESQDELIISIRESNELIKAQNKSITEQYNSYITASEENREKLDFLIQDLRYTRSNITKNLQVLHDHNLQELANKKPVIIEKLANDATKKVFDDIERSSNPAELLPSAER
jgi:uncharacterized phage infection (PIP) family protein YhgE